MDDFDTRMHIIRNFRSNASILERLWANILFNFGSFPLLPFQRIMGTNICDTISQHMAAGDIVLVSDGRRMGSFIIGFKFAHATLATGSGTVIHAVGDGVVETPIERICREYAYIIILRNMFLTDSQIEKIVKKARSMIGKPYDFFYSNSDRETFFCTKLVEFAYASAGRHLNLKRSWGGVVLPGSFLESKDLSIVYCSHKLSQNECAKC